jgi:hypothetical protein
MLPSWLQIGIHVLAAHRQMGTTDWERPPTVFKVDARTSRRFLRLAEFLQTHYPEALDGRIPVVCGSAVLLEFVKLHELSPEHARACATSCLAGDITVVRMRGLLKEVRLELSERTGTNHSSSNAQYAEFTKMAVARIEREPGLLSKLDLEINKLETVESRMALMPKMIAHCNRRRVALEIRAPQDSAARSVGNVAATLVSRIAVLRLRFDDVVLVMPDSSEHIALATKAMLSAWAHESKESLRTVDILLLGKEEQRWIEYSETSIQPDKD